VVRPTDAAFSACWTKASDFESSEEVASSSKLRFPVSNLFSDVFSVRRGGVCLLTGSSDCAVALVQLQAAVSGLRKPGYLEIPRGC
jgi:hypothetical protein